METPLWTEAMAVGETRIDAQHQALFEAAGKMLKAIEEEHPEAVLQETLAFLRRYTLRHFATEEAILQEAGFSDLSAHRALHGVLSTGFVELEVRAAKAGVQTMAIPIQSFIQQVLSHIQGDDANYIPFLGGEMRSLPSNHDGLSMGYPTLDEDHRSFLGILNSLQDASREGRSDTELPGLLEALVTHSREHFNREEMLMDLVDYPGRVEHAKAHRFLLRAMEDQLSRSRGGERGLGARTVELLNGYLRDHLARLDLAIVPYLQSLGRKTGL
ncbi:MAG: bacteriohemerythrin [Holophaga sp.]|nr:bacteriohemerythrin [Holophaga sp.]